MRAAAPAQTQEFRAAACRLTLRDIHALAARLRGLPCPCPPRSLGPEQIPKSKNNPERKPHGTPEIRSLPRPASSDRRESAAAVPPRPRLRRTDRHARLRRVLVRRASFLGLGNDRLAGNVFG